MWEGVGPDPRKADARLLLRFSLGQSPYYVSAVRKCVCFTGCTGVSIYAKAPLSDIREGSLLLSVTEVNAGLCGAVTFPSSSCTTVSEHVFDRLGRFVGALVIFTTLLDLFL